MKLPCRWMHPIKLSGTEYEIIVFIPPCDPIGEKAA
jgi:hypothetical protein